MAVPPPTKAMLRQHLRKRRQAYVSEQNFGALKAATAALSRRVIEKLSSCQIISAYLPIDNEIDTGKLLEAMTALDISMALPHIEGRGGTLRFLRWRWGDPLGDGPFGLKQPNVLAQQCVPDVILTPLLGFDRSLNRLGYGAGHYDRVFAEYPGARRIGLAWSMQECDSIPTDPWDIPLHAIATELEWITA